MHIFRAKLYGNDPEQIICRTKHSSATVEPFLLEVVRTLLCCDSALLEMLYLVELL
jgi:hypothetical protein